MTFNLRIHFRKQLKLVVLTAIVAYGVAHAGSYDDFFRAIKQDNPGPVSALIARGFDVNTLDPQGRDGLTLAMQDAEMPSLQVAEVLVDAPKFDVNHLNAKGESPLMHVALRGQLELAQKLIKKGADINKTGWTPLHYAASGGHPAIISLLLENSAYIDAESPNGTTPLMMAAQYGTGDAVKLLLQEGADPMLKNQQGLTALQFAERGIRPDAIRYLSKLARPATAVTPNRPANTNTGMGVNPNAAPAVSRPPAQW